METNTLFRMTLPKLPPIPKGLLGALKDRAGHNLFISYEVAYLSAATH